MIILDSNVLFELMRPKPEPKVLAWLDRQPQPSIWTTSVTVFEICFALQLMPSGRRRTIYTQGFEGLLDEIDHRIAPFDSESAQQAGVLMASRKLQARPRELRDTMIAGIVLARRATLVTRNVSHFDDLSATLINPWNAVV
jgi:predicted nucleic acid-binding protein